MTHQSDIVARLRAVPAIAFEHAGQLGIEDPSLAHEAAATIEALRAELAGKDAALADPDAVHANLLRGSIARPSVHQMIHIYSPAKVMNALDRYAREVFAANIRGEDDN